jgi:flagellar hook-associated protein 1 FlgK
MHDEMLFDRLLNAKNNNSSSNEEFVHTRRVESMLQEGGLDGDNISELTDQFFNEVQALASEPNDNALKENVKIKGEELINRGRKLNNVLNDYKNGLNEQKELLVKEANSYLEEIDKLTKGIQEIEAFNEFPTYEKTYANDLRDKRDALEVKLTELGNFKSTETKPSNYNYTFELNGGRLEGIDNSIKNINNLQNTFNNNFGPLANKVDEFINSDMSNPNEMIDWKYSSEPTNNINDVFINFSSKIDSIGNNASSTEAIMRSLEAKNDKLTKVNIDEELVDQIKYQRAYEAAAKVIQTADEMLKTLLDMKH